MERARLTAWPPAGRRIPFGRPVVPSRRLALVKSIGSLVVENLGVR